jgi:multidrug efflux pump subunit AcrB
MDQSQSVRYRIGDFFPMIILPGPTGDFIRSHALLVVYTLMASLIIALTFTPYLGSLILRLKSYKKKKKRIDLEIDINHSKASILGVLTHHVDQTVRIIMAGIRAGQNQDTDGEYYDMIIRNPDHQALDMYDFDMIFVPSSLGEQIKLPHVVVITLKESLIQIDHYRRADSFYLVIFTESNMAVNRISKQDNESYLCCYDGKPWKIIRDNVPILGKSNPNNHKSLMNPHPPPS